MFELGDIVQFRESCFLIYDKNIQYVYTSLEEKNTPIPKGICFEVIGHPSPYSVSLNVSKLELFYEGNKVSQVRALKSQLQLAPALVLLAEASI